MYLEKWKDTAFGSDYGYDFLEFLEEFKEDKLSLEIIYQNCNLEDLLLSHEKLIDKKHISHNLYLYNTQEFQHTIHYEEAIIALSALVIENKLVGYADTRNAYGSKVLRFNISQSELSLIHSALKSIYNNSTSFSLFELLEFDEESKKNVLQDILMMLQLFDDILN